MEKQIPDKKQLQQVDDVVTVELPAPQGWTKKLIRKPRRNEVVFISPTGEEIKTKKHLDQYVKSHPGSYSFSDFDWSTGDTPRRSARLSEKSNASESSGSETPKKKRKVEPRRKVMQKEKDDLDEEDDTADDKEGIVEENKENAEVYEDAEDGGEQLTKVPDLVKDNTKDSEKKSDVGEVVTEEPVHDDEKIAAKLEIRVNSAETEMEKGENMNAGDKASDAQNEDAENRPQPSTTTEDTMKKEALTASTGAEAAADLHTTNENPSVQELDVKEAASLKGADGGPTDGKREQVSQSVEEASVEKVENEELGKDKRKKDEAEKPIDNHPSTQ